jgi:serine protease Do
MNCSMCGNASMIRQAEEWYCPYCHHRQSEYKTEIVDDRSIKTVNIEEVKRSVLRLHVEDRVGTGFVISRRGLVLTNQHIIDGQSDVYGSFDHSPDRFSLKVLFNGNESTDLCLLRIESTKTFDYIPFSKTSAKLGDEVTTIGNPRGIGLSVSKGFISRIGEDGDLQLNIQLNPGNSGGPILNQEGQLVGIVSFLIEEIQAMSFAIGLPQIESFIEAAKGGQ